MRAACLLVAVVAISGCQTMKIATTQKIQPEGGDKGIVEYLSDPYDIRKMGVQSAHLAEVQQKCTFTGAPARTKEQQRLFDAAIWVPAVAKLAFDAGAAWLADYVDRIKKKSTNTYSARLKIDTAEFKPGRCLVIGRLSEKDESGLSKKLDSLVVVKIHQEKVGDEAIYLRPIFAWAQNSVALTKCASNCMGENSLKHGRIGISTAIVISGVVPDSASVYQTRQLATGVVSFPEVDLGGGGTLVGGDNFFSNEYSLDSDLMPAKYSGKNLQVSVSVTESGNIAGDFDKAAAEIAAIKGALGPAVEAQVTTRFKDD